MAGDASFNFVTNIDAVVTKISDGLSQLQAALRRDVAPSDLGGFNRVFDQITQRVAQTRQAVVKDLEKMGDAIAREQAKMPAGQQYVPSKNQTAAAIAGRSLTRELRSQSTDIEKIIGQASPAIQQLFRNVDLGSFSRQLNTVTAEGLTLGFNQATKVIGEKGGEIGQAFGRDTGRGVQQFTRIAIREAEIAAKQIADVLNRASPKALSRQQLATSIESGQSRRTGQYAVEGGSGEDRVVRQRTGRMAGAVVTDPLRRQEALHADDAALLRSWDKTIRDTKTRNTRAAQEALRHQTDYVVSRLALTDRQGMGAGGMFRVGDKNLVTNGTGAFYKQNQSGMYDRVTNAGSVQKAEKDLEKFYAKQREEAEAIDKAMGQRAASEQLLANEARVQAGLASGRLRTVSGSPNFIANSANTEAYRRTQSGTHAVDLTTHNKDATDFRRARLAEDQRELAAKRRSADAEQQRARTLEREAADAGRRGVMNNFLGGLSSRGFGAGGGGFNVDNLAASAGTSVKYAAIGTAVYGMAGAFAAAGKEALDYIDSQTELNLAMANAQEGTEYADRTTREYTDALTDVAVEAGTNVGQAMDIAASGIRAFGRDGETTQEQIENVGLTFSRQAQRMAVLAKTDIADAAGNLKAIGSGFELDPTFFSRINDAVAGAKALGGGDETQISQGLANLATVAQQAGFSIEQTATIISKLNAQTDQSGTLIASRLSRIFSILGGSEGQSAIRQLNSMLAPEDRITGDTGQERIDQLSQVFGDLNEAQQGQVTNALAGVTSPREFRALMRDYQQILADTDNQENFTGKGEEEVARRLEDLTGRLQQIRGEISNILASVTTGGFFDALGVGIVALQTGLDMALNLIQALNRLNESTGRWALRIASVLALLKAIQLIRRAGGLGAIAVRAESVVSPTRALARQNLADDAKRGQTLAGGRALQTPADVRLLASSKAVADANTRVAATQDRLAARTSAAATTLTRAQGALVKAQASGDPARIARAQALVAQSTNRYAGLIRSGGTELRSANEDMRRVQDQQARDVRNQRVVQRNLERATKYGDRGVLMAQQSKNDAGRAGRITAAEARRSEMIGRAALGQNIPRQGVGRDLASFRASVVQGGRDVGSGIRSFGTSMRGAARQFRQEVGGLGAIGIGLIGATIALQFVDASKRINRGLKQAEKALAEAMPEAQTTEALADSAKNLRAAADELRNASAGIFGTIENFLMGNPVGEQADIMNDIAGSQEYASGRLKTINEEAQREGGSGDLGDLLDFSSSEGLTKSLQDLKDQGYNATTILEAFNSALDGTGNSADTAAKRLSSTDQKTFATRAAEFIYRDVRQYVDILDNLPTGNGRTVGQNKADADALSGVVEDSDFQSGIEQVALDFQADPNNASVVTPEGKRALNEAYKKFIADRVKADGKTISDEALNAAANQFAAIGAAGQGLGPTDADDLSAIPTGALAGVGITIANDQKSRLDAIGPSQGLKPYAGTQAKVDQLRATIDIMKQRKDLIPGQLQAIEDELASSVSQLGEEQQGYIEGLNQIDIDFFAPEAGIARANELLDGPNGINEQLKNPNLTSEQRRILQGKKRTGERDRRAQRAAGVAAGRTAAYDPRDTVGLARAASVNASNELDRLISEGVQPEDATYQQAVQAKKEAIKAYLDATAQEAADLRMANVEIGDKVGEAMAKYATDMALAAAALPGSAAAIQAAKDAAQDLQDAARSTEDIRAATARAGVDSRDEVANAGLDLEEVNKRVIDPGDEEGRQQQRRDRQEATLRRDQAILARSQAARTAKIDPRDTVALADDAVTRAKEDLKLLKVGTKEYSDKQAEITQLQQASVTARVDRDNSRMLSRISLDDTVGLARGQLKAAEATLATLKKGTQAWYDQYKVVQQARKDVAQAEIDEAYNISIAGAGIYDTVKRADAEVRRQKAMLAKIKPEDESAYAAQQENVAQAEDAAAQARLQRDSAFRQAKSDPQSSIASAQNQVDDARALMAYLESTGQTMTTEYANAMNSLKQGLRSMLEATIEAASVVRQLGIDITNPAAMAAEAARTARDKVKALKDSGASQDVINAAELAAQTAENAAEQSAFSQRLSNAQTDFQLRRTSYRQYMQFLKNEETRLLAIGNRTFQQQEELNQVQQAIQGLADSMSAQFNLGDIKLPTVYQVRRYIAGQTQSAIDEAVTQVMNSASANAGSAFSLTADKPAFVTSPTTTTTTTPELTEQEQQKIYLQALSDATTATTASTSATAGATAAVDLSTTSANTFALSLDAASASLANFISVVSGGGDTGTTTNGKTTTTTTAAATGASPAAQIRRTQELANTDYRATLIAEPRAAAEALAARAANASNARASMTTPAQLATTTTTQNVNLTINGADFAKVVQYIQQYLGKPATSSRSTATRKV